MAVRLILIFGIRQVIVTNKRAGKRNIRKLWHKLTERITDYYFQCIYARAFEISFIPMKLFTYLKLTCYANQSHV